MIAGLVLAAGAGRRLGRPKAEVVLGGVRLLDMAASVLRDGGCDAVVAVVRSPDVRAAGVRCVVNPDPDRGMGSSLRVGLAALGDAASGASTSEAAVIVLVDQYGITAAEVARTIEVYQDGAPLVVARRAGRRSHPVLVARSLFEEFAAAAEGDQGGRAFIDARPAVRFVDLPDAVADIDTPDDLDLARARRPAGGVPRPT